MNILDIPEDWTRVSDLAQQYGVAAADVLALVECHSDIQLTGSGPEMMVCRLNP